MRGARRTLAWSGAALTVALALFVITGSRTADTRPALANLPQRLSDQEFWQLSQRLSEPGGTFHSENYISNESRYQTVIPELVTRVPPGGLYLGVGPEQNFTYITAIRPRMAFIVDIRRGNLLEHLLYKALMERSTDRTDFLARLFSRPRPAGVSASSPVADIFEAYRAVPADPAMFRRTLDDVVRRLTTEHGFALTPQDVVGIETIFRIGFFNDGPDLMYRRTDGISAGRRPTYAELMTIGDGTGRQRSYLASEASFAFLKDLQQRNMLVPVVGDFGGSRALRGVGDYARGAGATVSVFYLSNVETYLRRDGKWDSFCANVVSMPLDVSSTFIRSQSLGGMAGFVSDLGAMQAETRGCRP